MCTADLKCQRDETTNQFQLMDLNLAHLTFADKIQLHWPLLAMTVYCMSSSGCRRPNTTAAASLGLAQARKSNLTQHCRQFLAFPAPAGLAEIEFTAPCVAFSVSCPAGTRQAKATKRSTVDLLASCSPDRGLQRQPNRAR